MGLGSATFLRWNNLSNPCSKKIYDSFPEILRSNSFHGILICTDNYKNELCVIILNFISLSYNYQVN